MFRTKADVTKFVDNLEAFIQAVVTNKFSHQVEDAVYLNKMRDKLTDHIEVIFQITEAVVDETKTFPCPDCGGPMLLRTNRQNGDKFWGCTKYPNCRGTRDSAGLSRAERQAELDKQRENIVQDAGFSFNRKRPS